MQEKMYAIESLEYGSAEVFKMVQANRPKPGKNEILIKNHATTVTGADIMMRTGKPYAGRLYLGLRKPKKTILGFEFAGEVVEIGEAVTLFKRGDRVFGGTTGLGAYAEYVCVDENNVVSVMPDNLSFSEAAPVNGSAITVMNFLKGQGNIRRGQNVLINGASGALGTYAVQLAKQFGASVTGVCSTANLEMVSSLGADHVIDYSKEDFTQNGIKYDIIFDTVGKLNYSKTKISLTDTGIFLSSVANLRLFLQMVWSKIAGGKKVKVSATGMLPVKTRLAYFLELKEMLKEGKLRSIMDPNSFSLAQMKDAHLYVEKGHKKGNVVLAV